MQDVPGVSVFCGAGTGAARHPDQRRPPRLHQDPPDDVSEPGVRPCPCRDDPQGRGGTVDELTPLAVYPLSDEASYVNGAEITVDGGVEAITNALDGV